MQGADKGIEHELDGLGLHIGIVQARFNEGITNALAVACIRELEELGVHDIDHVLVSHFNLVCRIIVAFIAHLQ